jgi:inorganic pyrophosphatase
MGRCIGDEMSILDLQNSGFTAFDKEKGYWRVVIESPRGSRNKYKYDEELGVMVLSTVLPQGMSFPYDFGFLPQTLGDDGDPLDVLLLMDEPAFAGCIVPSRLVGVIEAKQTEKGKKPEKNDRLVAVGVNSRIYRNCQKLQDLSDEHLHEIQQFFIAYNRIRDKKFQVIQLGGIKKAEKLARMGMRKGKDK